MATTATPGRAGRAWRGAGLAVQVVWWLVACYVVAYLVWALWLVLTVGETGQVPPGWRDPDVPSGADVVGTSRLCGDNGCSRQTVLRPEPGQSPDGLAAELGLEPYQLQTWRWYDPHSVSITTETREGALYINVSYAPGL